MCHRPAIVPPSPLTCQDTYSEARANLQSSRDNEPRTMAAVGGQQSWPETVSPVLATLALIPLPVIDVSLSQMGD